MPCELAPCSLFRLHRRAAKACTAVYTEAPPCKTEFRSNQNEQDPVKLRKMITEAQQGLEALVRQSGLNGSGDKSYQLEGNKFM